MGQKATESPLTEPLIAQCLYCTGAGIERVAHAIQFIFWTHTPPLSDDPGERRIAARIAMPLDSARVFAREIAAALRQSGH